MRTRNYRALAELELMNELYGDVAEEVVRYNDGRKAKRRIRRQSAKRDNRRRHPEAAVEL